MLMFFFRRQNSPAAILARLISAACLFIAIFFLPWWVTGILALIAILLFKWFVEIIFLAYCADFLYYAPAGWMEFFHISLFALGVLLLVEWLRPRLLVP